MNKQTGITTNQMLEAVGGSIYIWPESSSLSYAIALANHLGRDDLKIYCAGDLFRKDAFRGVDIHGLIIDHAVIKLNDVQYKTIDMILGRIYNQTP